MKILYLITLFSVAIIGSHAALTSQVYWQNKLPNSPMPKAIRDLILSGKAVGTVNYGDEKIGKIQIHNYMTVKNDVLSRYTNTAVTILAKDMSLGRKLTLEFVKGTSVAKFLPRQLADSIPFSSSQLPQILSRVPVKPGSQATEKMKFTLSQCDQAGIGEVKTCATSLESLIDFTTSKLGKKVQAVSTEVNEKTTVQTYNIVKVTKIGSNDKTVVCHRLGYPYPVFYCHYTQNVEAYKVSLVGDDGTNVEAVTVCHVDPSKSTAVNIESKIVPVCHILPEDNVVWVPY
jgi:hypothetical protein